MTRTWEADTEVYRVPCTLSDDGRITLGDGMNAAQLGIATRRMRSEDALAVAEALTCAALEAERMRGPLDIPARVQALFEAADARTRHDTEAGK